jgi:hypothetical protein
LGEFLLRREHLLLHALRFLHHFLNVHEILDGLDFGFEEFECLANQRIVFEFLQWVFHRRRLSSGSRGGGVATRPSRWVNLMVRGRPAASGKKPLEELAVVLRVEEVERKRVVRIDSDESGIPLHLEQHGRFHIAGKERPLLPYPLDNAGPYFGHVG